MKKLSEKELLIALIKDDLINHRLVMGLEKLGLVADQYMINVSDTIFKYMGIKEVIGDEKEYAHYEKLKTQVMRLDLKRDYLILNGMAEMLYIELYSIKQMQKRGKSNNRNQIGIK
jgi:hypothetical protein